MRPAATTDQTTHDASTMSLSFDAVAIKGSTRRVAVVGRSALHDAERNQARHPTREPGALRHADHLFYVLVGAGSLLGHALARRRPDEDPLFLQSSGDLFEPELPDRGVTRQASPRAVTRRAERQFHGGGQTGEHVARGPHVAGDQDRLAVRTVRRGDLLSTSREGAGGSLAMYQDPTAPVRDGVLLDLGDVVGYVVDDREVELFVGLLEDLAERPADAVGDHLPVRPGEVRTGGHRREIPLPLLRTDRGAGELPVDQMGPGPDQVLVHHPDVIGRDLVAQSSRPAMEHDRDRSLGEAEGVGEGRVEQLVHALDLEKVVARPERSELFEPALARGGAHELRAGA